MRPTRPPPLLRARPGWGAGGAGGRSRGGARAPLALMAATLGLAVWCVEQLLEEERARAQGDVDERALNAELLRPELGGLVDVILAGPDPAPGRGWRFERRSQWHRSVALSLDLVGWHIQAVNTVLNGTHIPNAPLRERFVQIRAASGGRLSSELLARRAGVTDGTYLDRLLGLRPVSRHRRHGRVYGGRVLKAISVERAARIADALGVPHYEIP